MPEQDLKVIEEAVRGQPGLKRIGDLPDGDAAAKFALATGSRGNLRTTTLRGFEGDEAMAIIAATP